MKKLAKLVIFFSLSFAVIFLASTGLRFLALRVNWVQILPRRPETILTSLIEAAHWGLTAAIYCSMLLALSYMSRGRYIVPLGIVCLLVLSLGFSFGISLALKQWTLVPPATISAKALGGPGLILSNSLNRNETAVVLLKGPQEPDSYRVVAIPGRPLVYQEKAPQALTLPPIPFGDETRWFLKSLAIDIRLSAEQMQVRINDGLMRFLIYDGSLIFLLGSLGFILRFSVWPLVNLFIGCLAIRGVLSAETFFNSPEMQDLFGTFLNNLIPVELAVPAIFVVCGSLIYIYSILVYIAKQRSDD